MLLSLLWTKVPGDESSERNSPGNSPGAAAPGTIILAISIHQFHHSFAANSDNGRHSVFEKVHLTLSSHLQAILKAIDSSCIDNRPETSCSRGWSLVERRTTQRHTYETTTTFISFKVPPNKCSRVRKFHNSLDLTHRQHLNLDVDLNENCQTSGWYCGIARCKVLEYILLIYSIYTSTYRKLTASYSKKNIIFLHYSCMLFS